MQKHPTQLKDYNKNLEELANELGDLRYDALSEFLDFLSQKLEKDALADEGRNRIQLANHLKNASSSIKESSDFIKKAWKICETFMKE